MVGFLTSIQLVSEKVPDFGLYPFSIPAISALRKRRQIHPNVTVLVGENGSGKSTLLEAVAIAVGFNPEGGTQNFRFATRSSESPLHRCIRLARAERRHRTGFFFRAESFFNVATAIEQLDSEVGGPRVVDSYGGKSLHEQSHGESFMALVRRRFGPEGLYLLDEPEAALSVRSQLQLRQELHNHTTNRGSQIVMATHSPILMSLPGALIYCLGPHGIVRVEFEEIEAVQLMWTFLAGLRKNSRTL